MRPEMEEAKSLTGERASLDAMERRENLTTEFGSKKKKRQMSAAKSNMISTHNISGASQLENLFSSTAVDQNSDLVKQAESVIQNSKKRAKRN
jgi:hypothetical protein